jgi:hypothetical protein
MTNELPRVLPDLGQQHERAKRADRDQREVERITQMRHVIKVAAAELGYTVTAFDVEFEGDKEIVVRLEPR